MGYDPVATDDPLLTSAEAAAYLRIRPDAFAFFVQRGDIAEAGDGGFPLSAVVALKRDRDENWKEFLRLNEELAEIEGPLGPEYLANGDDDPATWSR